MPPPSTDVWMWTRELLLMVGVEGEAVGPAEQRELDVRMGVEGEEVEFGVCEEVIGGRGEACMSCDGLPQLRACSSHREQQQVLCHHREFPPKPLILRCSPRGTLL